MSLLQRRFDPFRELVSIQDRMSKLFGDVGLQAQRDPEITTSWSPSVDIFETPQEITVMMDLPGIKPEDINVNVDRDRLTISGERKFSYDVKREDFHRTERWEGAFARSFTLPQTVDPDGIKADYTKEGVLKVILTKREVVQVKQISVGVG